MDKYDSNTKFDYQLAFILFLLFCISCVAIYSAQTSTEQYTENFVAKQIFFYIVGCGIVSFVMFLDSDQLQKISWYLYGFGIFLLALLVISPSSIAPTINGAKSWFKLPGFSFQPSEFVKVFLIISLSQVITKHHEKYIHKTIEEDLLLLGKIVLTTMGPVFFVMQQPDLGTSLVMIAIMCGMIFMSGITWKILVPLFSSITFIAAVIFYFVIYAPQVLEKYLGVKQYQFGRIYAWLDPDKYQSTAGYHLSNSLKAIGSGTVTGKGFGNNEVYIPENHTDFIFSVIGEQFGFIGTSVVVSVFFLLIYHLTKLGIATKNPFYSYICVGVISMISFHVFQNIGMTIGLLPITGIPLPFISYGGSALMGNMFAMGLIFGIRYHYKKYMFADE
jgi:rod shape determining protein RodA